MRKARKSRQWGGITIWRRIWVFHFLPCARDIYYKGYALHTVNYTVPHG